MLTSARGGVQAGVALARFQHVTRVTAANGRQIKSFLQHVHLLGWVSDSVAIRQAHEKFRIFIRCSWPKPSSDIKLKWCVVI